MQVKEQVHEVGRTPRSTRRKSADVVFGVEDDHTIVLEMKEPGTTQNVLKDIVVQD